MATAAGDVISVIMPTWNAATTIDAQLEALAAQEVDGPWELVVSDNGSGDATVARVRAWASRFPSLTVVHASGPRGAGHARNVGVRAARGDRLLTCDADDVVMPGWVARLGHALTDRCLVAGTLDRSGLNPEYAVMWAHGWRALADGPRVSFAYLPFAATANLGFRRELFDAIGGFDSSLRRASDVDFGWRALLAGARLEMVPDAVVAYRLPATLRGLFAKGYADGLVAPLLYDRFESRGLRRQPMREVLRSYRWLVRHVLSLRHDGPAARSWAYDGGMRVGRIVGSIRHRTVFL
jgi:glycosyltransferase involved in cell wall biosynthesis